MSIFKEKLLIKNSPSDSVETPENTPSTVENAPEKISDNYFEQVNSEFKAEVLKGNLGPQAIEEIKARNEESFIEKVVDAIKNPGEAFKWLKTAVISSLAGSWLGDVLGLSDAMKKAKEKVMEAVKHPMGILLGILGGFAGFKALKGIAGLLKAPGAGNIGVIKKAFSGLRMATGAGLRLAAFGTMGYAAIKLYEYFTENEDEASSMPQDKESQKAWWKEKIEKSGLKKDLKEEEIVPLMALVMEEEKAEEMFRDVMNVDENGKEVVEDEAEKQKIVDENYGEMITAKEKINEKYNDISESITKNTKKVINELKRNDDVIKMGAILFGPLKVWDSLSKLTIKSGQIGLNAITLLLELPFKAYHNPVYSILLMLGMLEAMKESENIYVPKNDEQFVIFMKDLVKEKYEKTSENFNKAREKVENFLGKANLPFINETEVEKAIVYTEEKKDTLTIMIEEFFDDELKSIGNMAKTAIEYAGLSEKEIYLKRHQDVLAHIYTRIDDKKINELDEKEEGYQEQLENYNNLQEIIKKLITKFKNDEVEDIDLEEIEVAFNKIGMKMYTEGGYVYVDDLDASGIVTDTWRIMVDPEAKEKDELIKTLIPDNQSAMQYGTKAVFEKGRSYIHRLWNKDSSLIIEGGNIYLESVAERYFIAPACFYKEIIESIIKKDDKTDYSWSEAWVSYGDSILPIMIFHVGKILPNFILNKTVRKNKGTLKTRTLLMLKTLTFPVTAPIDVIRALRRTAWPIIMGNPSEAWRNIKHSDIPTGVRMYANGILSRFYGFIDMNKNFLHNKRQALIHAQKILHDYQYKWTPEGKNESIDQYNNLIEQFKEGGENLEKLKIDRKTWPADKASQQAIIDSKKTDLETELENNKKLLNQSQSDIAKTIENERLQKAKELIKDSLNPDGSIKDQQKYETGIKQLQYAGKRGQHLLSQDFRGKTNELIQAIDYEINKNDPNALISQYDLNTKYHNFDKLPEKQQIQKIHEMDADLVQKIDEFTTKKQGLLKKFSTRRKGNNRNFSTELGNLNDEYKSEIKRLYELRVKHTKDLCGKQTNPKDFADKHKIHLDEGILDGLTIDKSKIPAYLKNPDALKNSISSKKVKIPDNLAMLKTWGKNKLIVGVFLGLSAIVGYIGISKMSGEGSFTKGRKKNDENHTSKAKSASGSILQATGISVAPSVSGQTEEVNPIQSFETESQLSEFQSEEALDAEAELLEETINNFKLEYLPYLITIQSPNALSDILEEGAKANEVGNIKDLEKITIQETSKLVFDFKDKHEKICADLMLIMTSQADVINRLFKEDPELQSQGIGPGGNFAMIKWDKKEQKAYLQYAEPEEFIDFSFMTIDDTLGTKFIKDIQDSVGIETNPAYAKMGWEIGGNFIPFVGSFRDLYRGYINQKRGNYWQAFKDYAWGTPGLLLDIVAFGPGAFGKAAIKVATKVGASSNAAKAFASVGKSGKLASQAMKLNFAFDAGGLAYGVGKGGLKELDLRLNGVDPDIFNGKFYANGWENAQDIPFTNPGIIGMKGNKALPKDNIEEFTTEVENRVDSIMGFTYWKNANIEILNMNEIIVNRNTSDNTVKITRENQNKWNLEGVLSADGGYTFEQAFVMANLSNDTMEWLEKGKIEVPIYGEIPVEAANDTPFYVSSGGDIEFDQNWAPVAIDYISADSKWLETYKRSFGIPKDWIVNLLNRTYKKYLQKNSISGRFLELQNKITNKSK